LVEASREPVKRNNHDSDFNALELMKVFSAINMYLGKPQAVAQASQEVPNIQPNKHPVQQLGPIIKRFFFY
jgi:hypothetical protein